MSKTEQLLDKYDNLLIALQNVNKVMDETREIGESMTEEDKLEENDNTDLSNRAKTVIEQISQEFNKTQEFFI